MSGPAASVVVRLAAAGDAEAVTDLVQRAYRGTESRAGWTTEADLLDGRRTDPQMVRDLLTAPGSVVVLLEQPGEGDRVAELVACCHVQHRGARTTVGMIAVRPGRQGGGLGRRLLAEAEELARGHGAQVLRLTVLHPRSELIAWYERCGFRLTGEHEPFPYGDDRYGLPRREDLVLLVMEREITPS